MSEEVREKAIEPFFTTKPPGQGTGLGLSSIFGYVKQSKGHLKIDSAPDEGTTITILLPSYRRRDIPGKNEL
jgi:signal transduction histidine kinase